MVAICTIVDVKNYRYNKLIELFGEFDNRESYTRNETLNKII